MKLIAVILVLAVVASVGVYLSQRRSEPQRSAPKEFAKTQELVDWLASEAVDIAKENGVTGLDYSVDSIQKVEQVLEKLHQEYQRTKPTEGTNGLASAFGAYIGESIRRNEQNVKWEQDHPTMGKRSFPLHWRGGQLFPMSWCRGRIVNGPEDNVWHKYTVLRAERQVEK